jgi:hypothetical protein
VRRSLFFSGNLVGDRSPAFRPKQARQRNQLCVVTNPETPDKAYRNFHPSIRVTLALPQISQNKSFVVVRTHVIVSGFMKTGRWGRLSASRQAKETF